MTSNECVLHYARELAKIEPPPDTPINTRAAAYIQVLMTSASVTAFLSEFNEEEAWARGEKAALKLFESLHNELSLARAERDLRAKPYAMTDTTKPT